MFVNVDVTLLSTLQKIEYGSQINNRNCSELHKAISLINYVGYNEASMPHDSFARRGCLLMTSPLSLGEKK